MNLHDPHAIPWKELVIPQLVNFTLFVGLLIHFVRKPLAAHFADKNAEFEQSRKRAEAAKIQAERLHHDVQTQLKTLEESTHRDLEGAKKEALSVKQKMLSDASVLASRLEQESQSMAKFELMRAQLNLRTEMIQHSTQIAQDNLKKNVGSDTREALNEEFIRNIKAGV